MIDHYVLIGQYDVSLHTIRISTDQTIEDDSNPGKATITLVNPDLMYTEAFAPQIDRIFIRLFNFIFNPDPRTYDIFSGKVTDVSFDPEVGEITITGEDDLGHLVDALPHKFNIERETCSHALRMILDTHDTYIDMNYQVYKRGSDTELFDPPLGPVDFDEQNNYQDVLKSIQDRTGCLYYLDEWGRLNLYDALHKPAYFMDLDPFVLNPNQSKSLMGFVTNVDVVCYRSVEDTKELQNNPDHNVLTGNAVTETEYDPATIRHIRSPVQYLYNIHNDEDAQQAAENVQEFYDSKKDALTELKLISVVPPLRSLVKYDSFVPPDSDSESFELYGIVLERKVDYSIEGIDCSIKIHPKLNTDELQKQIAEMEDVTLTGGPTDPSAPGNTGYTVSPVFETSFDEGDTTFIGAQVRISPQDGSLEYSFQGLSGDLSSANTGWLASNHPYVSDMPASTTSEISSWVAANTGWA